MATTFLSILDYGDILYRHTSAQNFHMLDTAYHASLRFITNCKPLTHPCELYFQVGWPPIATRRLCHWYTFIYKAILGLLPSYLCVYIIQKSNERHFLRSQGFFYALCAKDSYRNGKEGISVFCTLGMEYVAKRLETN